MYTIVLARSAATCELRNAELLSAACARHRCGCSLSLSLSLSLPTHARALYSRVHLRLFFPFCHALGAVHVKAPLYRCTASDFAAAAHFVFALSLLFCFFVFQRCRSLVRNRCDANFFALPSPLALPCVRVTRTYNGKSRDFVDVVFSSF